MVIKNKKRSTLIRTLFSVIILDERDRSKINSGGSKWLKKKVIHWTEKHS